MNKKRPNNITELPEGATEKDLTFGWIILDSGEEIDFAYMRHRQRELEKYIGAPAYIGGRLYFDSNGNGNLNDDPDGTIEASKDGSKPMLSFGPVPFTRTVDGVRVRYLLHVTIDTWQNGARCYVQSGWEGTLRIGAYKCTARVVDSIDGNIGNEKDRLLLDPSSSGDKMLRVSVPVPSRLYFEGRHYILNYRFVESEGDAAIEMTATETQPDDVEFGRIQFAGHFIQSIALSTSKGETAWFLHPEGEMRLPTGSYSRCAVQVFNPHVVADVRVPLEHVYWSDFEIAVAIKRDQKTTFRIGAPLYTKAHVSGSGFDAIHIMATIVGQSGHYYYTRRDWEHPDKDWEYPDFRILRDGEVIESGVLQHHVNLRNHVTYSTQWQPPANAASANISVVIDRDLSGVGPREGLLTPVDPDRISRILDTQRREQRFPFVMAAFLLVPFALLLLSGNRRPPALWILVPHVGLALATWYVATHIKHDTAINLCLATSALTTIWLGAALFEGSRRRLALLALWLLPCILDVTGDFQQNTREGAFWGRFVSRTAIPWLALPMALALQAFWLRWRYRWWRFLLSFAVSLLLSWVVLVPVMIGAELVTQRLMMPVRLVPLLAWQDVYVLPSTFLPALKSLMGQSLVVLLPYVILTVATPLYRDRLFAICRRPGIAPPEGFANWNAYVKSVETPRSRIATRAIVGILIALLAIGLLASRLCAPEGKKWYRAAEPTRIGPGTPIEDQSISPLVPPLPDGITDTTYPTTAARTTTQPAPPSR